MFLCILSNVQSFGTNNKHAMIFLKTVQFTKICGTPSPLSKLHKLRMRYDTDSSLTLATLFSFSQESRNMLSALPKSTGHISLIFVTSAPTIVI